MAARKAAKRQQQSGAPDFGSMQPGMAPLKDKSYERLMWEADYYVHYEIKYASRAKAFIKYVEREYGKVAARNLNLLADHEYISIGKLAYIAMKGAGLTDEHKASIHKAYSRLKARADKIAREKAAEKRRKDREAKKQGEQPKVTIQQRMLEQIEELGGNIEEQIDQWMLGRLKVADFDPYSMIRGYPVEVKAPQAKLLRGFFERQLEEARLVVEFKDDDIKEAYAHLKPAQRKEYLALYEKVVSACDAVIEAKKAQRKPRVKKAQDKTKTVAKLKYKTTDPELGIASINPIEILDASEVWVYDTKYRKLGVYRVAPDAKTLGVKGTSIIGYDENTSVAKTVRKPAETLKGINKLPKTKIKKLHDSIKTTDTKLKGRLNDNIIIVRAF